MNLKEARNQGKLKEFIKEREKDQKQDTGDAERLQKTLKSALSNTPCKKSK